MGQKNNKPKKCSVQYFLNCSYRLGRLKRQQTSDKLRFLHRSYMRAKQNGGLTIEPWNHGTKNLKSLKNMVCCRLMPGSKYRLDPGLDFRFWKKNYPRITLLKQNIGAHHPSYPPAVFLCFWGTEWTLDITILFKALSRLELFHGLRCNQRKQEPWRKLTVNNGQASGFRGKIMLKRGLLNKLPYTFNGYHLVNYHNDVRLVKQFLGIPNLWCSSSFYIAVHFLPGISLLTLRCFVAEVRWLFPVSRQKKRESGKQRNTEPWRWELNENTAFTEISATCSSFYSKYFK